MNVFTKMIRTVRTKDVVVRDPEIVIRALSAYRDRILETQDYTHPVVESRLRRINEEITSVWTQHHIGL